MHTLTYRGSNLKSYMQSSQYMAHGRYTHHDVAHGGAVAAVAQAP